MLQSSYCLITEDYYPMLPTLPYNVKVQDDPPCRGIPVRG